MVVSGATIDPINLREGGVIVESEVGAIMKVHLCQHSGVVPVRTIHLQTTAKRHRSFLFEYQRVHS